MLALSATASLAFVYTSTEFNEILADAEQGDAEAQVSLGHIYLDGLAEGVKSDSNKSVEWFRLAAEQGNLNAQHNLGWLLTDPDNECEDDSKLFAAADCINGWNPEEGVKWFLLAAEQEVVGAYYLGVLNYEGQIMTQNFDEAMRWFNHVVDGWDGEPHSGFLVGWSQYYLGLMHHRGEGVAQDIDEAKKWYRLAAEHGHEEAAAILSGL
jgi:TPR repeat protein